MKKYCLTITYVCNWFCDYCVVDTHNQNITKDEVFKNIEKIENNSFVTLSGGELGTQTLEYLMAIINKLKEKDCLISVATNGLFLKKYYDEFYNDPGFDYFLYHCSENLDTNNIVFYDDPLEKIIYTAVVTNESLPKVENFLNFMLQHNIKVELKAAYRGQEPNKVLNKLDGIKLWIKYKDILLEESKRYLIPLTSSCPDKELINL